MRAFEHVGGTLRMSEALQLGIGRHVLYALHREGALERLSRGLYRLTSLPGLALPDLAAVCKRSRRGVICLISALHYHELGTQIPRVVDLALPRGAEPPRIEHPPIRVYWFSGAAYSEGIQTPTVDGIELRIYSPEKTVADAFRFRNKIGLDVAIEALKDWAGKPGRNVAELHGHARHCRVDRVMRPYLEAVL